MLQRFKDWIYEKNYPRSAASYEQWTKLEWFWLVSSVFIIFILSPDWVAEVAGRLYRMAKAKIRDGHLDNYYQEELERELAAMEEYDEYTE